jgi:hypothetical protein
MLRELNYRESDGISVTLFVETETMSPVIVLDDIRTVFHASFTVPDDRAMDAFYHPFTYADSVRVSQ